ncbi:MAG: hypothetical protein WAW17_27355 [Rhodococcus sp. (in: high G+C Gram-positive bacteria)]|uniref:hypothetical protein n=1 Tax=Rhodococcus sp. TaxID=1831 RepID=UPI003BB1EAEB
MDSPTTVAAQVRGTFVGAVSAVVSAVAHAIGHGGSLPDESAVVMLVIVCAALGAAVSAVPVRARESLFLLSTLAAGQVIGHATLMIASDHATGFRPGPVMIAAHIAAIGAAALLIRGAERACGLAVATVRRAVLLVSASPRVEIRGWSSTPLYRARLNLWLLISAASGTRAPPLRA